jgi:hypothetical protein
MNERERSQRMGAYTNSDSQDAFTKRLTSRGWIRPQRITLEILLNFLQFSKTQDNHIDSFHLFLSVP